MKLSATPLALVFLVLAGGWLVAGEPLEYGGAVTRMPPVTKDGVATYTSRSGLALEVDTRWFGRVGYRPVTARVTTRAAAKVDREIALTLLFAEPSIGGGAAGNPGLRVRQVIVLPAGEKEVTETLLCPGSANWRTAWWEVTVNGDPEPSLSLTDGAVTLLRGNSQPVALRHLRPLMTAPDTMDGARAGRSLMFRPRRGPLMDRVAAPLATDWLAYTAADIVTLDRSELQEIATSKPNELLALRRWLLSGGTVWIEQAGVTPSRLKEIEELLKITAWRFKSTVEERESEGDGDPSSLNPETAPDAGPAEAQADRGDDATVAVEPPETTTATRRVDATPIDDAPGWGYPILGERAEEVADDSRALGGSGGADAVLQQLLGKTTDTRGWYAQREVGFGRLLAFRGRSAKTPIALALGGANLATQQWVANAWAPRHGLEPGGARATFGNLLIPGVGVAPVTEFQILITLFVLVIGPLNFWLLWRRQQLQFLVITTPLCALAATLGLMAYAAVADGFGVKARVRSVTLLDQASGEAATWSRVSHYAAVAPGESPSVPSDTAVYPIRPVWESAIAAAPASRRVDWREDRQELTAGWLPSRTTVQHLAVRCRETPNRLVFASSGDGLEVSNQLGEALRLLLVRDSDGEWRRAVEVAAGAESLLEPVERMDALRDFRLVSLENQPEFPIGAGKSVEQTLVLLGAAKDVRRLQRDLSTVSLSDNLLNQQLATLSGLDGGRGLDLPPRTYVAVSEKAIETPLGWESVEEVGSFHVIVGRW